MVSSRYFCRGFEGVTVLVVNCNGDAKTEVSSRVGHLRSGFGDVVLKGWVLNCSAVVWFVSEAL